jgi:hypothetical protein
MSQPGLGFMISQLGGNEQSVEAYMAAIGKTILKAEIVDDALNITFIDGTGVRFYDDGQSCCEHRYMRTDDELTSFTGARLLGAEILNGPDEEDDYGVHEVQFLKITTSKGIFTVSSHNEHNGYYGGISCRVATL